MSLERLTTATIGLPISGSSLADIALGAYTDIVSIIAPSQAAYGDEVAIEVRVRNIWIDSFYIAVTGRYNGVDVYFSPDYANVGAGATYSFTTSFTMPNKDVSLHIQSFFWSEPEWYQDDYDYVDIALAAAAWQKLASKTIAITPEVVAWQKLATKTVAITPITWQKLASKTVQIAPVAVEWQKLASKTVTITPEEVPWELIQHTISHFAYIYDGDVEVNIATFKIDPLTPSAWAAKKFADALESEARKKGARVLETKVYVDTTPLLWTDIRIEVTGTPLGEEVGAAAGRGIAVGIAPWLAIILVCLAIIAVIIVATLAFKAIMAEFKKKPGLEDVKPAWGKEALILDIQDAEEYWERTPTPVETLEGMSEEELRDLLDKIAEEEVPPEISPWGIVALVGGLGILGVGAAVALATRPKE